jgi:hypothetical protein
MHMMVNKKTFVVRAVISKAGHWYGLGGERGAAEIALPSRVSIYTSCPITIARSAPQSLEVLYIFRSFPRKKKKEIYVSG